MRQTLLILPVLLLGACTAPSPQNLAPQATATTGTAQPAAVFNAPMDPGLIECTQLSNPAALSVATQWTLGQARAAALSNGTIVATDAANIASNLASFCAANSGANLRTAATQLNF